MSAEGRYYIGFDSGSVSLNSVVMDLSGRVLRERYDRLRGDPARTCRRALAEIFDEFPRDGLEGVGITGSGGRLIAEILGGSPVNEVLAQAKAVSRFHPEVRSVIEMGGEDSKLLIMADDEGEEGSRLEDFSMNTVCAAGTGSFLDQQAARVGVSIEEQFGELASRSRRPPRIAGRCSVFAKSDMIHLQQIATPLHDIIAGLCFALARNFKSDICRGKKLDRPVAFQGGVAANSGMTRAFREILGLGEDDLVIPRHFASMGAIGAALMLMESRRTETSFGGLEALDRYLAEGRPSKSSLSPLPSADRPARPVESAATEGNGEVFLGIDIGSISTNVVAIDRQKRLLSKRYLMTAGRPIEAVRQGLREVGEELGPGVTVLGVGTTGSGRYMTGDYVGADIVRNEITAQATAALHFDQEVDTIFEIGGQDSKYIGLRDGAVVDFEMNKVCAAGTGSFLEEQAERLGINIDGEFGRLALEAGAPAKLGERCTVFMDSDLVKQQQRGTRSGDLAAGLCYSIVHNYLNKVVGDRRVGDRIFLQGGIAFNDGVVAAFQKVTGKPITVPPHHDVTGAIGAALLAMDRVGDTASGFKGFDVADREYRQDSFACKSCSNTCEINRIRMEGEKPLFYGGRCEKYEVQRAGPEIDGIPSLFEEREAMLLGEGEKGPAGTRRRIGVPRVLHFYEFFPFWRAFLEELGFEAVPSPPSTGEMIREGMAAVSAEACFPVKIAHGHILSLLEEGVEALLLPSLISFPRDGDDSAKNVTCPYSQAIPDLARAILGDRIGDVPLLRPVVDFQWGRNMVFKSLLELGSELGATKAGVAAAFRAAEAAQEHFYARLRQRGEEVINSLEGSGRKALVLVGRTYNTCDGGVNLNFPRKIRELGHVALPMDFLPLQELPGEDVVPNMFWRTGKRIIGAVRYIRSRPDMLPVYLTNFGCGPDSFITHFFREQMEGRPYLQVEVDEHSADAGALTRLEAFLDSLPPEEKSRTTPPHRPSRSAGNAGLRGRTLYLPRMTDHAVALAAAFRAMGQSAEVLAESDEESATIGRSFTSGKECYPCIVTTGDIVRKVREPGFDPEASAFFMPTGDGPCRFGQYRAHHLRVLRQLGFDDLPILSLDAKNSYDGMGGEFEKLVWDSVLAVDTLDRLRRRFRPYAERPEEAEEIFRRSLDKLCGSITAREDLLPALKKAGDELSRLPAREEERPLIGVVGEIFLRTNEFSNEDLVRKIERFGGEVSLAPIAEWVLYTNFTHRRRSLNHRRYGALIRNWIKDRYQRHREKTFLQAVETVLNNGHEPPLEKLIDLSLPYLHHSFEGEAVLTVGKSIDMAQSGVSGIVSAMPFTCMPGTISAAISKKVREDYGSLPYLNMVYDGQGGAGAEVRLEAFIHQARSYGQNRGGEKTRH
jgi:predicted CoA-substrate-specific enzyme activase